MGTDNNTTLRWVGGFALAFALLALPFAANPFWTGLVAHILIFGLLALSVDLLMAQTGLFPMCNGAFFAVAAYSVAALEVNFDAPSIVAVSVAMAAALMTGALFGVSVRTGGVYFILITLALGQLVWSAAVQWSSLTGGDNGITNVPFPSFGPVAVTTFNEMYYLVIACVVAATIIYRRITRSAFGLSLNGIRESESRMSALGFAVGRRKYAAFLLSSLFAGFAGVLYAYTNQFVSPASASLQVSVEAALMPILGGAGTTLGAFVGALVIIGIRDFVSGIVHGWQIVMGLAFIFVVLFAPRGILGLFDRVLRSGDKVETTKASERTRTEAG